LSKYKGGKKGVFEDKTVGFIIQKAVFVYQSRIIGGEIIRVKIGGKGGVRRKENLDS
jgi:hypothetical protein